MSRPDRSVPHAAVAWLCAAVVGGALWWASELLVPAAAAPFPGHGERFANMVADPFAGEGDFPQRVLWPALAWLFGEAGVSPVAFAQLCNAALLAVVFWFARRRGLALPDAVLVTACIAASGAVLVYKPMACFSDPLNLLLLVLLVQFAARPLVFWPLVFVSALSHELVFFFAPWLVYLRCRAGGGRCRREVLWLLCALGAYLLVRAPMTSSYGAAYYFDKNFWVPWGLPMMWAVWAFLVLVEFGPLLVALGWAAATRAPAMQGALGGRWGLLLYFAGVAPLMLLAYDVMRFAAFAMLPVLLALMALVRARGGRGVVAALLAAAVGCYAWLHPVPSQQGGAHFTEMTGVMQARFGLLVTRAPGDAWQFTAEVVAETWWMWAGALVGLVAIVVAALALARVTGRGAAVTRA